jgi:chemotaxis protein histidine kinase CheA
LAELEGLSIKATLDASGMKKGATEGAQAISSLSDKTATATSKMADSTGTAGRSVDSLGREMDGIKSSGAGMSQSMTRAEQDGIALAQAVQQAEEATQRAKEAQEQFNQALSDYGAEAPQTVNAYRQLQSESEKAATATDKVAASQTNLKTQSPATDQSIKTTALAATQAASAAMALYAAYDNVNDASLAMEKANLKAEKSEVAATEAQVKYNEAIEKYGADSPEALAAQSDYQLALETSRLATETAKDAQDTYNEKVLMAGVTLIPTVISGIDGMAKAWKGLSTIDVAGNLGGITGALKKNKSALISAGAGMAAMGAIFMAFNTDSEETRVAMSLLAGGLIAAASAQWVWNAATAFGLSLTGVGVALVAVGAAAAVAVYALSSQYGAAIDEDTGKETDYDKYTEVSDTSIYEGKEIEKGLFIIDGKKFTQDDIDKAMAKWKAGEPINDTEGMLIDWYTTRDKADAGYAVGGISTKEQVATVSEGNKPEIHLNAANIEKYGIAAFPAGYTMVDPTELAADLAIIGASSATVTQEAEPTYTPVPASSGNTFVFNIYEAGDAKEVAAEVAAMLRKQGVM